LKLLILLSFKTGLKRTGKS